MQRYKALLEKTKTLFWNRWFTLTEELEDDGGKGDGSRRGSVDYFTKDMGGCAPDPR